MSSNLTTEEFAESLTGFEEIAIAKRFGKDNFGDLPGTMAARAMVFIDICRTGVSSDDAYKSAMDAPLGSLNGYFKEDDEITPDAPTTESGKDGEPLEVEPTT